jgi:hypothetical protein
MTDGVFQKAPYNRFEEFIAMDADRFFLLCSILEENGLAPRTLVLAGRRHIILNGEAASPHAVVVTAHYDRAAGSPGANDNSAAVFMLIEAAAELYGSGAAWLSAPKAVFVFTDKEELSAGEGINDQGAYTLALFLKEHGRGVSRVFCFDACGAGDTLIISTAADCLLRNEQGVGAAQARNKARELRNAALKTARDAGIDKTLLLPTPFSDDAGFLKAGIAAQTITVLPAAEAASFASLARTKHEAAADLITSRPALSPDKEHIPATWRILNGPGDTLDTLTPRYWKHVVQFAKRLCIS